ncbi:MAG: RNA polymerase sigma factor [Alphaproteobacteria bacterium]
MNEVIKKYQRYIRSVIVKLTGSLNDDLEQQVLIKTWENQQTYTERGKLKQYLGVLTVNVCRDYFKSKIHHQDRQSISLSAAPVLVIPATQEELTDAKKRQKIIWRAVRSLPVSLRRVIELKEFESYSLQEIAAELNIPVGTVKSRLNTARKILADKLSYLKGDFI